MTLKIFRKACSAGFTIVELLVAIAIVVLIVVMLASVFAELTKTSLRANQRVDAFRDARAAIQVMERDLTGLQRYHPAAYFAATDLYSDPNTAAQKNEQIFALASLKNQPLGAPTPVPGDVCAIGFYCSWANSSYTLKRYFRDSASTFNQLKTNGAGNYLAPAAIYAPASTDEILGAYIWNLHITPYDDAGNIIGGGSGQYPLVADPNAGTQAEPPAAIEISFDAMSPVAARTAVAVGLTPNDWMDSNSPNYKRFIAPHAYQFRTRISF